ncbi:hypothetical protein LR48_Vigan01g309500 [Vigna angularis]|uniref:Acyl-CoA-binding domain-containing protein n=2 Tax=Phaseolus angularis TaxID=3914 RepID=A0A0L9TTP8_PHAAN|nr:acyl-CoA-binding domain-containing protein 4 [Vigna angularis]KAG2407200.1 Acyl-CoA-binding domain-containing protein [Vigna angularis]KOM33539.1 hypothetical protein LR48_Vigan01g309500 [Vigna angularis]BAT77163.1 hypothetical protein VIGAN_01525600 [Vigna angularis var. angularis]
MFGFSRRRMKLGRLKVQLSEANQGTRTPVRHPKRNGNSNGEGDAGSSGHSDEVDCLPSAEISSCASGSSENWMVLSIAGDKPTPRSNHAAAVIGNKMVVVGGESGTGLLDDVQVLNFDRFSWTKASSKLYLSPSSLPLKIPACKGHSLVSWGKKALLIGGKTDPGSDRISVWAFDTETECWSLMEAKGDIPVARSGHSVVRAGTVLILFGGEDSKRRKLNDLHMFDLKSFTWLPLHYTGTAPSPRFNHVAALYDDKILYIFGGSSKSRTLNDLYSLDFETMAWSRVKIRGFHPSPRAGCCGVLCGTKWFITGGGSRKKRHGETVIFDIVKNEWSVAITSPPSSISTNKGFSMVLVQHKEKDFLVAFGGSKKEPSNQVEVLIMEKNDSAVGRQSAPSKCSASVLLEKHSSSARFASQLKDCSQHLVDSVARQNLASAIEHGSGRRSLSESLVVDPNFPPTNTSLRKQFDHDEEYNTDLKMDKNSDGSSFPRAGDHRTNENDHGKQMNTGGTKTIIEEQAMLSGISNQQNLVFENDMPPDSDNLSFSENNKSASMSTSNVYHYYESKVASLIRKNGILEGQLAASLASKEAAEKSLTSVLKSKQEMERKLADAQKEMELMREKLASLELAQEEANNLSNIVHSDNVRLEHDVAFLKAVLDDTQKELHSTRGVIAGERARAFQLQYEVFHLKQRLQTMENRASTTPRKPFHVQ